MSKERFSQWREPEDARSQGSERSDHCDRGYFSNAAQLAEIYNPTMSSAMSCVSETQRSDAATVCSNSIAEDIEVESVLSQEDHHPTALVAHQHSPVGSRRVTRARLVEFTATAAIMSHPRLPAEGTSLLHNMGPPLSRSLLQQKVEGSYMQISSTSSVKSFGSHTGSEVMSKLRLDDCGGSVEDDIMSSAKAALTNYSSRPSSVKSFGSAGTDDCSGSLDVETHSIETKSVHSQEDTFNADADATKEGDEAKMNGVVSEDVSTSEGRTSPGGTLYKGKGSFRYKGRFMHLPLMRFHHGGVHLDVDQEEARQTNNNWMSDSELNRRNINARTSPFYEESNALNDPRRDAETLARRNGLQERAMHHLNARGNAYLTRARSRSRSRSRSPSPVNYSEQRLHDSELATLQPFLSSGPSDSRSESISRAKLG